MTKPLPAAVQAERLTEVLRRAGLGNAHVSDVSVESFPATPSCLASSACASRTAVLLSTRRVRLF